MIGGSILNKEALAISKIIARLSGEFSKKSFPYTKYWLTSCNKFPNMPWYFCWNYGKYGNILLRVTDTYLDFFIKEIRQKMMSSSKSMEVGCTMYSKSGIRVVSMIVK